MIYKKLNNANCKKIIKDFKSSISCLPGKMINDKELVKSRLCSAKKYETNDIFNINEYQDKKGNKKETIRVRKNLEPSLKVKKLVEQTKIKRPENIKNMFQSQINFS